MSFVLLMIYSLFLQTFNHFWDSLLMYNYTTRKLKKTCLLNFFLITETTFFFGRGIRTYTSITYNNSTYIYSYKKCTRISYQNIGHLISHFLQQKNKNMLRIINTIYDVFICEPFNYYQRIKKITIIKSVQPLLLTIATKN